MRLDQVKTIGMLGGGVMGGGIAQVMSIAGFNVVVRDISDELIETTRGEVFEGKWGMKNAVVRGKLSAEDCEAAMARVSFSTDLQALRDVDFLIEAIPEKLDLKQRVFQELDGIVKPEAIFASNTSGFVIQEIARDVSEDRKTKFVGMHFSNPVPVMKICEVVHTPQSTQETVDTAVGVSDRAGRVTVLVKDMPGTYGFIFNRVFAAARREADRLVEDGIATKEDIDKAMIYGRNWPVGFYQGRGGIGKQW